MTKQPGRRRGGQSKSKAESFTGKKASKVEVRSAGVGDNSGLELPEPVELNADDFHFHLRAIKAATEKKDTANNLLRGCYKAAKKVHPGLADAIKEAISVERENDPAKLKARLDALGFALKQTGCQIQLTVFDTLAGDVADQAYKRGFADGKAGRSANNKYPDGSDLAGHYARGWSHGTGKNLGLSPDQVDAAERDREFDAADPAVLNGADEEAGPQLSHH